MVKRRTESSKTAEELESEEILKRSSVYREFVKEKNEINKLKWLESEKLGEDIGYQRALMLWAHSHRNMWAKSRRSGRKKSGCGCKGN